MMIYSDGATGQHALRMSGGRVPPSRVPPSRGRTTRRFKAMAAELRQHTAQHHTPCCYCGQPIDLTLWQGHPRAFTTAHWQPVATHPHLAEDPDNIRGPAHRACNSEAGTGDGPPKLGDTSADW